MVCRTLEPILLSRSDVLTPDTARQVEAHNNTLWCACPDMRPHGFDAAIICGDK